MTDHPIGQQKKYYYSIDLIKCIAMLMVIIVHYNQQFDLFELFKFGQMGCQLFFVVSGYASAGSLSKDIYVNSHSKCSFYKRRLLSIAPSWWIMIVFVYIINTVLLVSTGMQLSFGTNRNIWGIICNFLFLNGLVPFCNNNVVLGGWYIGTTAVLYLLAPFIYKIINSGKCHAAKYLLISIVSELAIIILCEIFGNSNPAFSIENNTFAYFSFLNQAPCFAIGILLWIKTKDECISLKNHCFDVFISIFLLTLSIYIFFNPIIKYMILLKSWLVSIFTYYAFRVLKYYEEKNKLREYQIIKKVGRKTLSMFLIHPFFVWPFISIIRRITELFEIDFNNYFIFWFLLCVVVIFTYYSSIIFDKVVYYSSSAIRKQIKI